MSKATKKNMEKRYCKFTEKGIRTFDKQKIGEFWGESRDKKCWRVLWKGRKTIIGYHKSFIKGTTFQEFHSFNNRKNNKWEKRFDNEFGITFFSRGATVHLKTFIAKELAKKDKEFIEILNGLEMNIQSPLFSERNKIGEWKIKKMKRELINLIAENLNNKIKQIKQKYV